jgi:RHS repeat-associated protein
LGCPTSKTAPTFFTFQRLAGVTTWTGANPASVDSWVVGHDWVKADANINKKLFVRTVQRTTAIASSSSYQGVLPYIRFDSITANLENRTGVAPSASNPAMKYYRIDKVTDEFGGITEVTYATPQGCNYAGLESVTPKRWADYQGLQRNCYQAYYFPKDATSALTGGFLKWMVTDVKESDPVAGNPAIQTHYDYANPAWRRDFNVLATIGTSDKFYNNYRGAETVITTVGQGATRTKSVTWYFTGMQSDVCPSYNLTVAMSGCAANAPPSSYRNMSFGAAFAIAGTGPDIDEDAFRGRVRATQQVDYATNNDLYRSYNHYTKQTVIQNGYQDSVRVVNDRSSKWTNSYGAWKETRTDTEFGFGTTAPTKIKESGFIGEPTDVGDERCTAFTYDDRPSGTPYLRYLTSSTQIYASVDCTAGLKSRTDTAYNTQGSPISVTSYKDAASVGQIVYTSYDTWGRPKEVSAPTTATTKPTATTQLTRTTYTPTDGVTGGLLTGTVVIDPMGQQISTTVDPKRGLPTVVTDNSNGTTTTINYDGIGRTATVFLPDDQPTVPNPSPNPSYRFTYSVPQPGVPSTVGLFTTTEQKQIDSPLRYQFTRSFLDGLGRPRETHGRSPDTNTAVIGFSRYDDRGLVERSVSPFPHNYGTDPTASTVQPIAGTANQFNAVAGYPVVSTTSTYDALGRPTQTKAWSGSTLQETTNVAYSGRYTVVYPQVGQYSLSRTDAYGRTELVGEEYNTCCTGETAVARRSSTNTMVVFGIGLEGDIWRKEQLWPGGYFGDWTRVSAVNGFGTTYIYGEQTVNANDFALVTTTCCTAADIAITTDLQGLLVLFGTDNGASPRLWETHQTVANGAWSPWTYNFSNAGTGMTNVAATRFNDGRVAVAVRVNNGDVWVARQSANGAGQAYSNMVNVPGGFVSDIGLNQTVDMTYGGNLFLVGIGNGGLAYNRYEGSPNNWSPWAGYGTTGLQSIATERYGAGFPTPTSPAGTLITVGGYGANPGAGAPNGYFQWNTQNAAGGTFNSIWSAPVRETYRSTSYDVLGNVTSTTDPNGNTTTNTYDFMSRKLSNVDPDKRTAVGQQTSYAYTVNNDGTSFQTMTDPYDGTGGGNTTTRYEAENGARTGATQVESTYCTGATPCSNNSSIGNMKFAADSATFSFNIATAGPKTVKFRYSAALGAATRNLTVGTTAAGSVSFPATATWGTWTDQTATITFPAGATSLKITGTGDTWTNFDYIEITDSTGPQANTIKTSFDVLGRPTLKERTSGTPGTAGRLAEFAYDTLPFGKGRLTSASQCDGSTLGGCPNPVTTTIGAYDSRGRVTSKKLDIPGITGGGTSASTVKYEAESAAKGGATVSETQWCPCSNNAATGNTKFAVDTLTFTVNNPTAGAKAVNIRYSAAAAAATRNLTVGSTAAGSVSLPVTATWGTWTNKSTTVTFPAGTSTFTIAGTGDTWTNFDYIEITEPGSGGGGGAGGQYTFGYTYDKANHRTSVTYPAQLGAGVAEQVNTAYDIDGRVTTVAGSQTYVALTQYRANGMFYARWAGTSTTDTNGIIRAVGYDQRNRLNHITASRPGGTFAGVQSDIITRDAIGNVTQLDHAELTDTSQNQSECFRYDERQRLTNAWTTTYGSGCAFNVAGTANFTYTVDGKNDGATATGTGTVYGQPSGPIGGTAAYNLMYAYDMAGNLLYQGSPTGQTGNTIQAGSYKYKAQGPNAVQPHAVYNTSSLGNFVYNANGSMTERGLPNGQKQCMYYTPENWLSGVSTVAAGAVCPTTQAAGGDRYRYDVNGQRVSKVSGTATTVYLDGIGEITVNGATTDLTKYYQAGSATFATKKNGVLTWLLTDYQGGIAVSVPATTGGLTNVARQRYLPYGQRRGNAAPNDNITQTERGFLGQIEDASGLNYLNNRYHDPTLGRFISVDPLVSMTHDAYGYGNNNPIRYSDPSGLMSADSADSYASRGGSCGSTGNGTDIACSPNSAPKPGSGGPGTNGSTAAGSAADKTPIGAPPVLSTSSTASDIIGAAVEICRRDCEKIDDWLKTKDGARAVKNLGRVGKGLDLAVIALECNKGFGVSSCQEAVIKQGAKVVFGAVLGPEGVILFVAIDLTQGIWGPLIDGFLNEAPPSRFGFGQGDLTRKNYNEYYKEMQYSLGSSNNGWTCEAGFAPNQHGCGA